MIDERELPDSPIVRSALRKPKGNFRVSFRPRPTVSPLSSRGMESLWSSGLMCRIGFLDGQILVPEDFDRMGSAEIEGQFQDGE